VTLRAIQATVERRDRALASAVTMIWASALTAGAVSMSVVVPRVAQITAGQERSGWPSVLSYGARSESPS
jgi:hypothetical protein